MRGCHQEIGLMAGSEPGYNHWRLSLSSSAAITSAPTPPHGVGVDCRWCGLLGYQLLVIFPVLTFIIHQFVVYFVN